MSKSPRRTGNTGAKPFQATLSFGGVCVIAALVLAGLLLGVGITSAGKFKSSTQQLTSQLADSNKDLELANIELESLFSEVVGNLDHRQIPLDRAARIVLRRGQKTCLRIATTSTSSLRKASAYCTLGHIHHHLQDLSASVVAYERAMECVADQSTTEALLIRAYATNHLVQSLATLGHEAKALLLCQQIRSVIESSSPSTMALMDELGFVLQNQTILLASEDSDAIPAARANIELLDALTSVRGPEDSLLERQIDASYLLAGLLWRRPNSRSESIRLLREVENTSAFLVQRTRERLLAGESAAKYSRYKAEARRAKRELTLAEQTMADSETAREPAFWTRKNLFRGRRSVSTEILLDGLRMPAEFEEQEAILLRWSGHEWQDVYNTQLIGHLMGQVPVRLLVDDLDAEAEAREALVSHGIRTEEITFYHLPANTVWLRDFGPLTVLGREGFPIWVDYQHLRPDEQNSNDLLTERLARLTGNRSIRAPLLLEGGNLVTNGRGLVVCTQQLEDENLALGFTKSQFHRRLRQLLGCQRIIVLENLEREGTGHIDWFLTFVSPTDVVIGSYDRQVDPANAAILDRNARVLSGITTAEGPLHVHRIPMPPHPEKGFGGTYTNVVFANGKLIVPTWSQASQSINREALAVYSKLLPDWTIQTMDCTGMLPHAGAIRCSTVNIPALPTK